MLVILLHAAASALTPQILQHAAPVVSAAVAPTAFAAVAPTPSGPASSFLLAAFDLFPGVEFFRDGVDAYYFIIASVLLAQFARTTFTQVIDDAKDYDRRGELANQMMQEKRKRERAEARDAVRKGDMAYERLQAEKASREKKKSGWKLFD